MIQQHWTTTLEPVDLGHRDEPLAFICHREATPPTTASSSVDLRVAATQKGATERHAEILRRLDAQDRRARAKSALRGLTCGDDGQRPESGCLGHRYALPLHGDHSTPAQVRATWGRSVDPTAY